MRNKLKFAHLLSVALLYALVIDYYFILKQLSTKCSKTVLKSTGEMELVYGDTGIEVKPGFIMRKLPKTIFMLWDKGFANAPAMQKICLNSFRRHNVDFKVYALNLTEAEEMIERRRHYSDQAWSSASIQAKSDIIRVELLAKFGGIWADATVYCKEPLLNWLNDTLLSQEFLAYERRDSHVSSNNSPWISSWFLVATNTSVMIQTWMLEVRDAWSRLPSPLVLFGYYWVHRIFRNLVISNITFGEMFKAMPFLDAAGPHCKHIHTKSHIYKLKLKACRPILKNIYRILN